MTKRPEQMKAVAYQGIPGFKLPQLVSRRVPAPGPGQVLIQTAASALNPIDWKLRKGILGLLTPCARLSAIPGFDFVGKVVALGAGASRFAIGDRVFGMLNFRTMGSLSDFLIADEAELSRAGDHLDDATLAGLPLAGMTALQAIRDLGQLKPLNRLLVVGGSGGVGHLGVQIGKALGARVTAVTGPRNVDHVRQLGADEVINYAGNADLTGPFDVILDAVVSKSYRHWAKHLSPSGTYVSALPSLDLLIRSRLTRHAKGKKVRIIGVHPSHLDLEWLRGQAEQGSVRLIVDSRYRLETADEAIMRSQSGRARGKIILVNSH